MKYIFEINIYTDGDFGFPYVPRGMIYDGGYTYTFKDDYNNKDKAINDVMRICTYLKNEISTSRDYIRKYWYECIENFIEQLENWDNDTYRLVESQMWGNYDGTKFSFYTEGDYIDCGFCASDEEIELIKNNIDGVTNEMIKEAVLDLFRKGDCSNDSESRTEC